jgi:hypothetical protein
MTLQIRVFRRNVEPGNLEAAVSQVSSEANAFLATLAVADVADVRTETATVDKYSGRIAYSVTVVFVE